MRRPCNSPTPPTPPTHSTPPLRNFAANTEVLMEDSHHLLGVIMLRKAVFAGLLCTIILSTLPAFADVHFGRSARSAAMGGAGLAMLDDPLTTSLINPAAMALVSRKTRLVPPGIEFRTRGTSLSRLLDSRDLISDSKLGSAIALAREFGDEPTLLSIDASAGVEASTIAIEVGRQVIAGIFPNNAFVAWATSGTIPGTPSAAKADVSADTITYMPSIVSGWKIPQVAGGRFYVGSRAKWLHSVHYGQTLQLSVAEGATTADIVADGAETKTEDDGFAMDLGMAYQLDGPRKTTYGFVATNFLHTDLSGISQERLVSLGVSTRPVSRVLVAADLVNIWKAYGEPTRLRLGAELQLSRGVALRAGYSGDDFTCGFGLFGYDFAYSKQAPFSIAQTLAF
jgi:hypothetical protein